MKKKNLVRKLSERQAERKKQRIDYQDLKTK